MAGLRESRPSPPRGGKHKDISPIIGAIAMGMGGGGAAAGADAGAEDLEAGEGASYGNRATAPTALQPDYSKLLTKPGFGLNLLSRGGASSAYNSAVAGLAQQQMAGGQQLDLQNLRGTQAQSLAVTQGDQSRQIAHDAAIDSFMKAHDLPPTAENFRVADDTLFSPALSAALAQKKLEQTQTGMTQSALENPNAQANANAGVNAKLSAPFFDNMAKSKMMLNPMEAGFAQGDVTSKPTTGLGSFPGATSVSDRYAKDPATGFSVKTTTSTPSFGSPSFNFDNSNAPSGGINLRDIAEKLKAGEDSGQDDFDETPLPQVQAKPQPAGFNIMRGLSAMIPSNIPDFGYEAPKQTPEQINAAIMQKAKAGQATQPSFSIEDFAKLLQQFKSRSPSLQQ